MRGVENAGKAGPAGSVFRSNFRCSDDVRELTARRRNAPRRGRNSLISGRVKVVFLDDDEEDVDVRPGDGLVVPKGTWHRVDIIEPSQIVYLTPGPNNQFRPVPSDA
ncbi:MAG: cupin domain-containing protein [Proteobacteria bacterium]|nr:cupin domain-containing protein [Pseudomonadota bacterium]